MRAAIMALMLMIGSQVGFSYRKLGTKCETKNVEMETLNRNRIDYTLYRRLLINLMNFVAVPGHWGTLPLSMKGALNGTTSKNIYRRFQGRRR